MQDFNGSASGISAREQVVVTEPVGTDVRNSQSIRTPVEKLANLIQYLMQKAGILDAVSTWTAKQAFSAGLSSGVAPSAATDVARKTEVDAEATARASAVGGFWATATGPLLPSFATSTLQICTEAAGQVVRLRGAITLTADIAGVQVLAYVSHGIVARKMWAALWNGSSWAPFLVECRAGDGSSLFVSQSAYPSGMHMLPGYIIDFSGVSFGV